MFDTYWSSTQNSKKEEPKIPLLIANSFKILLHRATITRLCGCIILVISGVYFDFWCYSCAKVGEEERRCKGSLFCGTQAKSCKLYGLQVTNLSFSGCGIIYIGLDSQVTNYIHPKLWIKKSNKKSLFWQKLRIRKSHFVLQNWSIFKLILF